MEDLNKQDYNKKILKLSKLDSDKERLKMIYMWVKTKVITFNDFEALVFYCN